RSIYVSYISLPDTSLQYTPIVRSRNNWETRMLNTRFLKAGATALLLATTAFTAPAFAEGKLVVSSPQDPGSWDPIDTFLVNWASAATNIFDGLTYRGPDM